MHQPNTVGLDIICNDNSTVHTSGNYYEALSHEHPRQIQLSASVGAQLQHALHASLLASSCSGGVRTLLMCTRDDDDDTAGAWRGMVVERFWLFLAGRPLTRYATLRYA